MALQFYNLKVSKVTIETAEAVSISFEVPDELVDTFRYRHGQFLTLKLNINGELLKRAYSISSSAYIDNELTVTVKEIENGFVSKYLNETIAIGDVLEVMPPRGKFTVDLSAENQRHHFLFAGGSGITPIISILKSILAVESKSKVLLVYANKNQDTIIFKKTLDELELKNKNFKVIHALSTPNDGWGSFSGRLGKSHIKDILNEEFTDLLPERHYYLCGPYGLMKEIENLIHDMNTEKKFIHKESFNSGTDSDKVIITNIDIPKMPEKKVDYRNVKIKIYNEIHELVLNDDDTILTSAMREGHDPPFSCQIGACGTCRARLVSGEVRMEDNDALTDDEITEGYILTCQSHPTTENVFVDFDD